MATQLGVFRLRHRPLLIVDRRPSTSTPPRTQAGTRSRSTVQAIRLYIQLFSEYHTEATSLRFLLLTLSSIVVLFTARLALPRRSSDTQRCHSPIPTGGESISSVPTRSSVQLLPVGVWLAWNGFAPFSPSPSPQSPLVDAASALVLLLRSCHRAAHHSFSCSPPTAPPSSSSSPLPPFVQSFSFPLVHVLLRILVLTPQRIRRTPSGSAVHFARYPLPGGRIRTASGPGVHLHSLSAAKKAYPDPEWSSRSSSLATRRQEGVSGSREVQPFIFSHYPLPGRRLRDPGWSSRPFHSLSASRKAYRDPEWSRRSSSLAIRPQEGVSRPRAVQAFVRTRYPPSERRIGTPSGPAVHFHSLSATGEAFPDRDWSYRSSSLAIRRQEGAPRPRVVQPFIFTRCPLPGRRIRTATGPGDYLLSLSAARKPHPDPEWSNSSSSLAIRHQEGVSGPRVVQAFIRTRYPPPERRIRTPSGPAVHIHSLSAARKAYPDPEWSRRSSSLAIRRQECAPRPRVVQPFIFTRCPLPGRRIRTATGPGDYLLSLSAARKPHPDPEWSNRSSSLAIRHQEGVCGPRVVQAFIRTRYPLPERRIRTPSGPVVHLHSLSAARKAYPDPEWSRRSSSLAIRRQECAPRPRVVQPYIFTRYPLPGRRIRTAGGPAVHLHSLSAAGKAYPDPEWSRRSSSPAVRCQEGVSRPRAVQAFILTRYPLPGRRLQTPSGPTVHLHSLSAARKAYPDPEWSSRSSSLAIRCQEGVSGPRVVQAFIFTRCPLPGRRIQSTSGPGVYPHSLSAARKASPDPEWSSRSSSLAIRRREGVPGPRVSSRLFLLAIRRQEAVSGPPVVHPFIFSRYPPPGGRFRTATGPGVHLRSSIRLQEGVYGPEGPTVLLNSPIRRSEDACGSRMVQSFSSARLSATR